MSSVLSGFCRRLVPKTGGGRCGEQPQTIAHMSLCDGLDAEVLSGIPVE